jgi:multimeric flavodoxin WrbA
MTTRTPPKGIIVFGSARSDGNTGSVVQMLASITGFDVIDLNVLDIRYFDYASAQDDDFMHTILKVLEYDVIVFATPVYWYAMSAVLKTFFDRLSDLLHWHKQIGRQFRSKSMGVVSTSGKTTIHEAFAYPFVSTARYLGMEYLGHCHCWTTGDEIPKESAAAMAIFVEDVLTPEDTGA